MDRFYKVLSFLPLMLVFGGTILAERLDIVLVTIPLDSSFHFGLMTVNALFGGFLYSNYSMLVGLLDNSTIHAIQGTKIMVRRNTLAIRGIVYAVFSVLSGIYITLMVDQSGKPWDTIYCFAINCEIVFMITSITYYLLSLRSTNILTKALYNSEGLSKDEIERTIADINNEGK